MTLAPLFIQRERSHRARRTAPSVIVNPIPFGWSKVGETLFYRFEVAPPSLLAWANTDEVAHRQGRERVWPHYVVVLVPDSTDLFHYAREMEEFNCLNLGVGLAGSWATIEAWLNAAGS